MRKLTLQEWNEEGKMKFGNNKRSWKFVCPNCGNVQSYNDFVKVGIADPGKFVNFFCIGRFLSGKGIGEIGKKQKPCNYTAGGLFQLCTLKVVDKEGKEYPSFEFAESEIGVMT